MRLPRFLLSLAIFISSLAAGAQADRKPPPPTAAPRLSIDQLVEIKHPAGHQWASDGRHAFFTYDEGGVNNVWAVPADGTRPAVPLTIYPDGQTSTGGFTSLDGGTFFFQRAGGLMAVPIGGGTPAPAWPSAARGTAFTLSPDGTRIAYVVGGPRGGGRGGGRGRSAVPDAPAAPAAATPAGAELVVHTFAASDERTVHIDGAIGALAWSPDSRRLAFVAAPADIRVLDPSSGSQTSVLHGENAPVALSWSPDGATLLYSTGGVGGGPILHQVSPPEVGAKLIFVTTENGRGGGGATFAVPAAGGTATAVGASVAGGAARGGGGSNWLDATHLLVARISNGGRTRTTESIDIGGGPSKVLHEETQEKFFSAVNNTTSAISPDHRWLLFTADSTGWDQVYVMPTSGGTPVQVSKVRGEHWRAVWSHDSRHIAWDTNTAERPGDRQIEIATIGDDPARATIVTVTAGRGTNTAPQWSPDDSRILYQHTDAQNSADLYVAAAAAAATPTRLTSSMPADIDKSALVAPQFVHYPGPDGKPVPAWLFVPRTLDRGTRHPAIVWIHPDGVNQNYDGWHPDRNEAVYYELHQYLLQQGYVVIAPDYRGSIGYGRDWRNDVYMDVGGNDAKDARMAAGYLKTLGYVDGDRIGVWGLSYGGFFTLQAITQEPTLFRCAIDVAGVTDYELYYEDPYHGGWTTSRIGTPQENPEVYAKARPMQHVDQIQRPLLILAGTADVNVPFLESVLLVDRLLKAGKGDLVTFMMYPGEFHYFDRSFVVRDAWRRVDDFFRQHLRPEVAAGK